MCPEWVTRVIMPNKDHEGKIRGLPIIELRTDKEVVDTHIAIGGERIDQFDVLGDETPETTEEETQHVQGKRVGVVRTQQETYKGRGRKNQ